MNFELATMETAMGPLCSSAERIVLSLLSR